jgi:hypothetical protein
MGLSQEQQIMQVENALKDQLNSLKFDYEHDSFSFSYSLLPPGHVEY